MLSSRDPLRCRLIVEGADAGPRQMAVDELLLASAAEGCATLRFYEWSEPTLSLGYFQSHRDRDAHAASRDCALVRRPTGGGAILHDRELTYSLAIPRAHPLSATPAKLYDAVHDGLIRALGECGLAARRRGCGDAGLGSQPFLCFQRRAASDVMLGAVKICGSAQRRRRSAVLQHGSLLLAASPRAAELPGIFEVAGKLPDPGELAAGWGRQIARGLTLSLEGATLSTAEGEAIARLAREKYACPAWTRRR
jgi:lipoate-protein ligase A